MFKVYMPIITDMMTPENDYIQLYRCIHNNEITDDCMVTAELSMMGEVDDIDRLLIAEIAQSYDITQRADALIISNHDNAEKAANRLATAVTCMLWALYARRK